MVIIQFITFWIIAGFFLYADVKSKVNRWLSATSFLAGIGVLLLIVEYDILPLTSDPQVINFLKLSISFMRAISNQLCPYTGIMFAIYQADFLTKKYSWLIKPAKYVLIIPPAAMFFIYPFIPEYNPSFLVMSLWVTPYLIIIYFLMIYSYIKENNAERKQQRLLLIAIIIPTSIFSLFVNFILRVFNFNMLWKYNTYTVIAMFAAFMFFSIRYGISGVRIKFEKQRISNTMKAMTSGTSILNHALKNEVLTILLCLHNIKSVLKKHNIDLKEVDDNINLVKNSTDYLVGFVKRMYTQTADMVLVNDKNSLAEIVKDSLGMVTPQLRQKNIKVTIDVESSVLIICDKLHIQQVLINIFNNAVEAMESGGHIKIITLENSKKFSLIISDNGCGISKHEMPYIFDPFFSTKNHTENFGLGLSYCYNVMQRHDSLVQIDSLHGFGTNVTLSFPLKRVERVILKSAAEM